MKHSFRILVGMLLLAIPLCMNAQVKPKKEDKKKPQQEMRGPVKPKKVDVQEDQPMPKDKGKTVVPKKEDNPEKDKKGEKPEKKESKGGFEMPKISGFVQAMYQVNLNGNGELASNTFNMRRVRLAVDGTLFKNLTYKIQGDFVRSPMLVDAYLKYKVCDEFSIQLGQFKTPFSLESPINPVNLEIFDYGECITKLVGYDDVCGIKAIGRDIGLMASGSFIRMKGNDGEYHIIDYAVGVFNGNGCATLENKGKDDNSRKDIVGRINVHPGLKNLTLSGSYYNGKYNKDEFNRGTRDRWAVGAQYNDGDLVVRAEYLNGYTGYQVAAFNDSVPVIDENGDQVYVEGLRNSKGFYAVAGYNFKLGKDKSQKLMPVLRYEHFEPGDVAPNVYGSTNFYTVGVSYWPLKSVNCKLDYSLIQHIEGEKTNSHRIVAMVNYKF